MSGRPQSKSHIVREPTDIELIRQDFGYDEQKEWERIEERFDSVCKKAYECDIPLLIDAEESWMQIAADDLVTKMMCKYNTEKAIVYILKFIWYNDFIK